MVIGYSSSTWNPACLITVAEYLCRKYPYAPTLLTSFFSSRETLEAFATLIVSVLELWLKVKTADE
jgi:hypothetical protein